MGRLDAEIALDDMDILHYALGLRFGQGHSKHN